MNSITETNKTSTYKTETFGTGIRGQALMLLSRGIPTGQVAEMLQCTPGFVSQLKADPVFAAELEKKREEVTLAQVIRDDRLDTLEDLCIDAVELALKNPLQTVKPMEAVSALRSINGLQRRSRDAVGKDMESGREGKNIVILDLPTLPDGSTMRVGVGIEVVRNKNNELVAVDGQTLDTVPTGSIMKTLESRKALDALELDALEYTTGEDDEHNTETEEPLTAAETATLF